MLVWSECQNQSLFQKLRFKVPKSVLSFSVFREIVIISYLSEKRLKVFGIPQQLN